MARDSSVLLELTDVVTYYGRAQALRDVSLSLRSGEIVALLGANGAGKTTTLMAISGIIRPRRGQVIYRGAVINREKPSTIVKKGIAQCPAGRSLFPDR